MVQLLMFAYVLVGDDAPGLPLVGLQPLADVLPEEEYSNSVNISPFHEPYCTTHPRTAPVRCVTPQGSVQGSVQGVVRGVKWNHFTGMYGGSHVGL